MGRGEGRVRPPFDTLILPVSLERLQPPAIAYLAPQLPGRENANAVVRVHCVVLVDYG
jgi:hypothetical protein